MESKKPRGTNSWLQKLISPKPMKNNETNAFYSKSRQFLIQKIDSKQLDLTVKEVLEAKIQIFPMDNKWIFSFPPNVAEKFSDEIWSELNKIFVGSF